MIYWPTVLAGFALLGAVAWRLRAARTACSCALEEAVALADAAPDGILLVAADGLVVRTNARLTDLLGYSVDELVGQPVEKLVPEAARATHRANRESFESAPATRPMGAGRPLLAQRKDGTKRPVGISLSRGSYAGRQVTICFVRDITDAQLVRAALTEANTELRSRMVTLETQGRLLRELERASELLQRCVSEAEAYGLLYEWARRLAPATRGGIFLRGRARERVTLAHAWGEGAPADAVASVFATTHCWALRLGRSHRSEPGHGACEHHDLVAGTVGFCIPLLAQGETLGALSVAGTAGELSELQEYVLQALADRAAAAIANVRLREALREQSMGDSLTGLRNRRFFEEALERALDDVRTTRASVALLLVDLDHFKTLNDSCGHQAGDALLRATGGVLLDGLRSGDIAARLGGDEFAVLLTGVDRGYAQGVAQRLGARLKALRVRYQDRILPPPSVSIGVAFAPDDATDADELLREADRRLYAAKRAGRDRTVLPVGEITQEVRHVRL